MRRKRKLKGLTQKEAVLNCMHEHGSITSMQTFKELGVTRLSAIIFNLRKESCDIYNENITITNRYGKPVTFVKYRMK